MPFSAQSVEDPFDLAYLPLTHVPTEDSGNLFPSKMSLAFSRVIIPQLGGVNLLYRKRYNPVPVTACPLLPCVLACYIGHRLDGWAGTCKYSVGGLRHAQWSGDFLSTSCLLSCPSNPLQSAGLPACSCNTFPGTFAVKALCGIPMIRSPHCFNM